MRERRRALTTAKPLLCGHPPKAGRGTRATSGGAGRGKAGARTGDEVSKDKGEVSPVSGAPIGYGGILAAGAGRRLRDAGWTVPKPMVPVAGAPLIEGVIRNFTAAGIRSLAIILNEQGGGLADWVRAG